MLSASSVTLRVILPPNVRRKNLKAVLYAVERTISPANVQIRATMTIEEPNVLEEEMTKEIQREVFDLAVAVGEGIGVETVVDTVVEIVVDTEAEVEIVVVIEVEIVVVIEVEAVTAVVFEVEEAEIMIISEEVIEMGDSGVVVVVVVEEGTIKSLMNRKTIQEILEIFVGCGVVFVNFWDLLTMDESCPKFSNIVAICAKSVEKW